MTYIEMKRYQNIYLYTLFEIYKTQAKSIEELNKIN